jgi:uncharacterized protein
VAERGALGIPVSQEPRSAPGIARLRTGVTAFIGRTLKGPLHRPVSLTSFAEFQRTFGGLWQPSTLSYAVEQFFENGGQHALVVRVTNGARPPSLTLRGPQGALQLTALNPGSREYLRAAVDYDGIDAADERHFNLTVQRLQSPGSERIEDQEIWPRVSLEPDSARFIGALLASSHLVRICGGVPGARPAPTLGSSASLAVGYVASGSDADDGGPLSDYDVIGEAIAQTGLHALWQAEHFDLLCIPALSREQDVGFATLLVAVRLCRVRHAMLVVDPPAAWDSAPAALAGLRRWPLRTDQATMFFPRVLALDRLRNRTEPFGSAAAACALIARADQAWPLWAPARGDDPILRPSLKPALVVTDADRTRLAQFGVNTLQAVRLAARTVTSLRTLAAASSECSDWQHLSARRLALFILACIERGTRWLGSAQSDASTWTHAQQQVGEFLEALNSEGAFASTRSEESYFVICDERVNTAAESAAGRVNLLFGIAITRPADFHPWMVSQGRERSHVRAIVVNRLTTSLERVEAEIESSILRS